MWLPGGSQPTQKHSTTHDAKEGSFGNEVGDADHLRRPSRGGVAGDGHGIYDLDPTSIFAHWRFDIDFAPMVQPREGENGPKKAGCDLPTSDWLGDKRQHKTLGEN